MKEATTKFGTKTSGVSSIPAFDPDAVTGDVSRSAQGSRTTGVAADPVPTKAAYKDGYETNYADLPGYENHA